MVSGGFMAGYLMFESRSLYFSQNSETQNNQFWRFPSWWRNKLTILPLITSVNAEEEVPKLCIKPWDWNWDGRHYLNNDSDGSNVSAVASQKSKPIRHLLFIRHGQYHYAEDDADCRLTELGREQLSLTGMRLKQLGLPYKVLRYSTMTRAVESTEVMLEHLPDVPVEPCQLLCEGAPYILEPALPYYQPSKKELIEDGQRIENAFKLYVHRANHGESHDSYEIFVCHANVIRYFVCRALQLPPEAWIRFSLDHGSITWIVVRPDGRVSLRWLGNSGHMPPEKITIQ